MQCMQGKVMLVDVDGLIQFAVGQARALVCIHGSDTGTILPIVQCLRCPRVVTTRMYCCTGYLTSAVLSLENHCCLRSWNLCFGCAERRFANAARGIVDQNIGCDWCDPVASVRCFAFVILWPLGCALVVALPWAKRTIGAGFSGSPQSESCTVCKGVSSVSVACFSLCFATIAL